MDVSFAIGTSDDERRAGLYRGEIIVLPATPASLELVRFARKMIEDAFAPYSPRTAYQHLEVTETVQILSRLKPQFIHHPRTRFLLRDLLLGYGCNASSTYQDVPRLRAAYPASYLTTGIAYAHHPHRDTWYSAPPCQLNWWMPLYDFDANQGMAFHPAYWDRAIVNGSSDFNYYRWNAVGRQNAANHIKSDTRVQPRAEEPIELEPAIRLVVPPGSIILFSADQLHSTVHNETAHTRWSIDFRTVDLGDVLARHGAPVRDVACSGTSLRDFRRADDFEPMPAEAVALYDDGSSSEGMAVFAPGASETVEQAAKPAPVPPPVSKTARVADCRPTLPSASASDDHAKLPAERSPADSRIVAGE